MHYAPFSNVDQLGRADCRAEPAVHRLARRGDVDVAVRRRKDAGRNARGVGLRALDGQDAGEIANAPAEIDRQMNRVLGLDDDPVVADAATAG